MSDYQVMPELTPEEYLELKTDIARRGVMIPIEYDELGNVLDGYHRLKICGELGIKDFPKVIRAGMTETEKLTHARKLNMARRQLTSEQRRELIRDQLKATPEQSDRQIAKALGVDHKTIGLQRHEMEGRGEIPHIESTIDTLGREQPRYRKLPIISQEIVKPESDIFELGQEETRPCQDKEIAPQNDKLPPQTPIITELITQVVQTAEELQHMIVAEINVAEHVPECESVFVHDDSPKARKPHVSYNSGNNEWYTPSEYIELARRVMGSINLDPASSDKAQEVVQAEKYYTAENDGLSQKWCGNIWLNPPYSSELITKFTEKFISEFENIEQAIILVNNATETEWFSKLVSKADAVCFPKGRVKFYAPNGEVGAPLQGQALLYYGMYTDVFVREFNAKGWCALIQ